MLGTQQTPSRKDQNLNFEFLFLVSEEADYIFVFFMFIALIFHACSKTVFFSFFGLNCDSSN